MIFREEFHKRLESVIGRPLTEHDLGYLDIGLEKGDKLKKRLDEVEEEYRNGRKSRWNPYSSGYTEYHDISEVKTRFDADEYTYCWLYDKKTKTFICNLGSGSHCVLMSYLYCLYNNIEYPSMDDHADLYFLEGYGCYVSGAMQAYIAHKASTCVFDGQERMAFKGIEFRDWHELSVETGRLKLGE